MENITLLWVEKKLFLENKGHGNPKACECRQAYAYAYSRSTYASFMLGTFSKHTKNHKGKPKIH